MKVIDLEERESKRVFEAHWALARRLRMEAEYVDPSELPSRIAAVNVPWTAQFLVDRDLCEEELDVAADLCALMAETTGRIYVLTRADLAHVLGL
ncbi:MAG: hypothetical protein M3T56_09430 [Chloroflexota bacterium]|nr:hypothetical protein [Chloroflexota bacterium]